MPPQLLFKPNPKHALAAPGNALDWSSNVYDDATTFEGLTKEGIPHGKGVMWMGSLRGGAGFQHPVQGDRCGAGCRV